MNKKQSKTMNAAKERKRLESNEPDYPLDLPNLRRMIIVVDFDFGKKAHTLKLYKTNRVDLFRVECDGKVWKDGVGFSNILARIRKSMPRVRAI